MKKDTLTSVIEREKDKQNGYSLKGALAQGRKVAAKAPVSMVGWLQAGITKAVKMGAKVAPKFIPQAREALQTARALGKVKIPGDIEVAKLDEWATKLRRLRFQTDALKNSKLKQLLNQRTKGADAAYDEASKLIREGQAMESEAQKFIAQSTTAIKLLQSQMLTLKIPSLKSLPSNIYSNYDKAVSFSSEAKSRLEKAISKVEQAQSEFSGKMGMKQTMKEGGKALVDTGSTFAGRVGGAVEDFGEGASKALDVTAKGFKAYGEYIPIILVAGGVLYIVAVSGVLRPKKD